MDKAIENQSLADLIKNDKKKPQGNRNKLIKKSNKSRSPQPGQAKQARFQNVSKVSRPGKIQKQRQKVDQRKTALKERKSGLTKRRFEQKKKLLDRHNPVNRKKQLQAKVQQRQQRQSLPVKKVAPAPAKQQPASAV